MRELVFGVAGGIGDGGAGDECGDRVLRCKVLPRERGVRSYLLDGCREQRAEKSDRVYAAVKLYNVSAQLRNDDIDAPRNRLGTINAPR